TLLSSGRPLDRSPGQPRGHAPRGTTHWRRTGIRQRRGTRAYANVGEQVCLKKVPASPFSGETDYEQDEKGLADVARVWCGNRRCRIVAIGDGVANFLIGPDPLAYMISLNL